jgi:hypothetical protein
MYTPAKQSMKLSLIEVRTLEMDKRITKCLEGLGCKKNVRKVIGIAPTSILATPVFQPPGMVKLDGFTWP